MKAPTLQQLRPPPVSQWGRWQWSTVASLLTAIVLVGNAYSGLIKFEKVWPVTHGFFDTAQAADATARQQLSIDIGDLKVITLEGQIQDRFSDLMDVRLKLASEPRHSVLRQYERFLVRGIQSLEQDKHLTGCVAWRLEQPAIVPCPPPLPSILE